MEGASLPTRAENLATLTQKHTVFKCGQAVGHPKNNWLIFRDIEWDWTKVSGKERGQWL